MFFCVTRVPLLSTLAQSAHLKHTRKIAHQSGPSAARETPYM